MTIRERRSGNQVFLSGKACNDLYILRTSKLYRGVSKPIVDPVVRQTSIDLWDNARLNGSYVTGSRVMYHLQPQDVYQKILQHLDIIGVNNMSTKQLKLLRNRWIQLIEPHVKLGLHYYGENEGICFVKSDQRPGVLRF